MSITLDELRRLLARPAKDKKRPPGFYLLGVRLTNRQIAALLPLATKGMENPSSANRASFELAAKLAMDEAECPLELTGEDTEFHLRVPHEDSPGIRLRVRRAHNARNMTQAQWLLTAIETQLQLDNQ